MGPRARCQRTRNSQQSRVEKQSVIHHPPLAPFGVLDVAKEISARPEAPSVPAGRTRLRNETVRTDCNRDECQSSKLNRRA